MDELVKKVAEELLAHVAMVYGELPETLVELLEDADATNQDVLKEVLQVLQSMN